MRRWILTSRHHIPYYTSYTRSRLILFFHWRSKISLPFSWAVRCISTMKCDVDRTRRRNPSGSIHEAPEADRTAEDEQRAQRADTEHGGRHRGRNIADAETTEAGGIAEQANQSGADRRTDAFKGGDGAGGDIALAFRRGGDGEFHEEAVAEAKADADHGQSHAGGQQREMRPEDQHRQPGGETGRADHQHMATLGLGKAAGEHRRDRPGKGGGGGELPGQE